MKKKQLIHLCLTMVVLQVNTFGVAQIHEIYGRYFTTSPDPIHLMTNRFINKNAIVTEYTVAGTMVDPEKNSPDYMRGKKSKLKACSRMNMQQG